METGVSGVGGTSMFSNQILEQRLFVIISLLLQIVTLCLAFELRVLYNYAQKLLQTGATVFCLLD